MRLAKSKVQFLISLGWLMIAMAAAASAQMTPELGIRNKTPQLKAFTNATIVVSPQVRLDSAAMLVDNGKIIALGKQLSIPTHAVIVDLKGSYVYPGFIDAYTDYGVEKPKREWSWDRGPQYTTERSGGNAWNEAIQAQRNWGEEFRPDSAEARNLIESGFTIAQTARLDGIFRGRSAVVSLSTGLPNDLILRPYSHHMLSFDKGTSKQNYPESLMGSIALIRQTFLDVDWYTKARSAYLIDPMQKMPEFNSAIEALARAQGEPMIFDPGDELSLLRAEKIAKEFGLTFVYLGSGFEYAWLNDLAATRATLILPLTFPKAPLVKTVADQADVTLAMLRHWDTAPDNPRLLAGKGVRFALTSYGLKNRSDFWKNLRLAVKRGLSKETALASLTTVPAEICGISDIAGTLDVGKLANFAIFDGDPFEKEAELRAVVIQGKEFEYKELPKEDLRGVYKLWLGSQSFDLSLKGKADAPKGELKLEKLSRDLKDITVDDQRITFSAKFDTLGFAGVMRFSGQRTGKDLAGICALAGGEEVSWRATLTELFKEPADSAKSQESADTLRIAKITYPNLAYGVTAPPPQENVLVKNATVWTSEAAGVLESTDLLIRNGKIAAIGKGLAAPDARVIDATGKHVTAGIIDEHSHIAIAKGVNEGTHAITPEVRIGDVIDPEDISIYRLLAGGVTMSQLLHGSANPIGGQAQVIKLKWGENAEGLKYRAAPPTIKFALGENVKQSNWGERFNTRYPQTRMGVETIIKDAFQTAREYDRKWRDYNALGKNEKARTIPPRRDLLLEATSDVINARMFIHCHSYVYTEILMLMRLAEEFGFKVQNFTHVLEGYKVADELREHGATANSFADWWAYKFEVYEASAYNPALLAEKGVVTGVNSDDAEMARRLNQEAGKSLLYGGMKPEQAIKMVTINPAIQLKVEQHVGSLQVGKDADFVIWSGNPLSTFSKVEQTWIEGRRYFDLSSDSLARVALQQEKNALIQKVLKEGGGESKGEGYRRPEGEWHCEDVVDIWRIAR